MTTVYTGKGNGWQDSPWKVPGFGSHSLHGSHLPSASEVWEMQLLPDSRREVGEGCWCISQSWWQRGLPGRWQVLLGQSSQRWSQGPTCRGTIVHSPRHVQVLQVHQMRPQGVLSEKRSSVAPRGPERLGRGVFGCSHWRTRSRDWEPVSPYFFKTMPRLGPPFQERNGSFHLLASKQNHNYHQYRPRA